MVLGDRDEAPAAPDVVAMFGPLVRDVPHVLLSVTPYRGCRSATQRW